MGGRASLVGGRAEAGLAIEDCSEEGGARDSPAAPSQSGGSGQSREGWAG